MKKLMLKLSVLPVIVGLVIVITGSSNRPSVRPSISAQPEDQMVRAGSYATLSVNANDGDRYQWLRNGVILDGQTRSTLLIQNIEIADAGNYSCKVTRGRETVTSTPASLLVFVRPQQPAGNAALPAGPDNGGLSKLDSGGSIVVYGSPVASSGSSGTCPGSYAGYVNYTKTIGQGWGWAPDTNTTIHTATDGNRTDTKVEYVGKRGDNGCNQTVVTVPDPAYSTVYRFSIYFPNNVPNTNYPITLDGFNP